MSRAVYKILRQQHVRAAMAWTLACHINTCDYRRLVLDALEAANESHRWQALDRGGWLAAAVVPLKPTASLATTLEAIQASTWVGEHKLAILDLAAAAQEHVVTGAAIRWHLALVIGSRTRLGFPHSQRTLWLTAQDEEVMRAVAWWIGRFPLTKSTHEHLYSLLSYDGPARSVQDFAQRSYEFHRSIQEGGHAR